MQVTKMCNKCGKKKSRTEFYKRKKIGNTVDAICKLCRGKYCKAWRKENPERVKAVSRAWTESNAEFSQKYHRAYKKQWKKGHRQELLEKGRNPSIQLRMTKRLRTRIYHAIKGAKKSMRTVELLGCSIQQFLAYVEARFKNGMNWANYGDWHIDHIIPCSHFNLKVEKEQKKCFHYSNLQPLWAIDNMRKSNKRRGD